MPIGLQAVLVLCAGYALWRLWRSFGDEPRVLQLIIAGGFLIRAFAAQLLFWVSWLQLPYGRSLQLGHGLWFFGVDARAYFWPAADAAEHGLWSIVTIDPRYPSIMFIRALAVLAWLFGSVMSVAILLNVTVYFGMAWLIVRWAKRHDVPARITAIPLLAIAYLPSWILWSLQPLKDAFFCFLIMLFAFAVDSYVAAWKRTPGSRASRVIGATTLIIVTIFLLAGVRWYYAAMALGAAALVGLSTLFVRSVPAIVGRALLLACITFIGAQAMLFAAGPYVPPTLVTKLRPWTKKPVVSQESGVQVVVGVIESSRKNIDGYTKAGTTIRSGKLLTEETPRATTTAAAPKPVIVHRPATTTAPTPTQVAVATPVKSAAESEAENEFSEAAKKPPLPRSVKQRLIAGGAALLLPRSVAVNLGLVSIGGGRGMMWFAELDTILFDIVMLTVIVLVIGSLRRGAWRDPFVWYLIVVSCLIGGALAYTISNYGTLLRHRGMVVASGVLLAIAVRRCARADERVMAKEDEAPELVAPRTAGQLP